MAAFISEMITSNSEFCITGGKLSLIMDASSGEILSNNAGFGSGKFTTSVNEENSSGPDAPDTAGGNWTRPSITLLISTRRNMDAEFISGTTKHFKLWAKVASILNLTGECKFTGVQCHSKWRNLVSTYTKNKIKLLKDGADAIKWEYFQAMDDARGKDFVIPPPGKNLTSPNPKSATPPNSATERLQVSCTFGKNLAVYPQVVSPSASCSSHELELTISEISKFKRSHKGLKLSQTLSEPPQWFKDYTEKRERQMLSRESIVKEMWEERKQMEVKKMRLLQQLLNALTEE